MKLNKLHETITSPSRSEISTRIVALMDKSKLLRKPVAGTKLESELEIVDELIDRAIKNKNSFLTIRILKRIEEHINKIIFSILKRNK